MAGVDGDGEVGAAGDFVGGVHRRVDADGGDAVRVDAGGGDEMAAGGEAEDADLVRVDVPLGGVEADQADGALRVFQRDGRLRIGAPVRVRARRGYAVLQQHTGDAARYQPVADLGAFEIDGENLIDRKSVV